MSKPLARGAHNASARSPVTLTRVYRARIKDVWELWTTKEGIESWWGPAGFAVKVRHLDLRPGGEMRYAMTAVEPEQAAFMRAEGMPLTTETSITYTEIVPRGRLAYELTANFIPGVEPYVVEHVIELQQLGEDQIKMILTIGTMHDDEWTERAVAGFGSQLGRLEARIKTLTENPHD
ncbi:MAG TPA: SRPBCC domain-containing protein [Candidatus Baltobacteraceae bacterium]|jgi:uncharacterized protein YndB with AHSA1/START domain